MVFSLAQFSFTNWLSLTLILSHLDCDNGEFREYSSYLIREMLFGNLRAVVNKGVSSRRQLPAVWTA